MTAIVACTQCRRCWPRPDHPANPPSESYRTDRCVADNPYFFYSITAEVTIDTACDPGATGQSQRPTPKPQPKPKPAPPF